jgi:hypothetical protein
MHSRSRVRGRLAELEVETNLVLASLPRLPPPKTGGVSPPVCLFFLFLIWSSVAAERGSISPCLSRDGTRRGSGGQSKGRLIPPSFPPPALADNRLWPAAARQDTIAKLRAGEGSMVLRRAYK